MQKDLLFRSPLAYRKGRASRENSLKPPHGINKATLIVQPIWITNFWDLKLQTEKS